MQFTTGTCYATMMLYAQMQSSARCSGVIMSCEEKARLADDYRAATAAFAEAVRELQQRIGTSTSDEYGRLRLLSDEARMKSEQARLAFELHTAAHHC